MSLMEYIIVHGKKKARFGKLTGAESGILRKVKSAVSPNTSKVVLSSYQIA